MATVQSFRNALEEVVLTAVEPDAAATDAGRFPRRGIDALARAGLLGLISSPEVGGMGKGFDEAVATVERVSRSCASTAMVLTMHYCATAVIEARGDRSTRHAIAAGRHLSTLAFSKVGSRSHFWVPLSTASAADRGRRARGRPSRPGAGRWRRAGSGRRRRAGPRPGSGPVHQGLRSVTDSSRGSSSPSRRGRPAHVLGAGQWLVWHDPVNRGTGAQVRALAKTTVSLV